MVAHGDDWSSSRSFARTAATLAVRDYGFPEEAETRAFVDGFGDLGLDAVAVAIGQTTILEPEDVPAALAQSPEAPVRILLLQAKRHDRLQQRDVDLFGIAAQRFLTLPIGDLTLLKPNPNAQVFIDILQAVRLARPQSLAAAHVTLVFAYAGVWRDFNSVNLARQLAERNIKSSMPELRFEFVIWGESEIVEAGHRVGPDRRKALAGARLFDLPPGEARGFIGFVSARELALFASRKHDDKRVPLDFLFLDNVRADLHGNKQWRSPGAEGISRALRDGRQHEMLVSHNGIVIVARAFERSDEADEIVLFDPQIINGCQTVHTLVRHFDQLGDAHVPMKIIVTEDDALKDRVVIAANTQANVEEWDILSRHRGVRALEPYFQNGEKPMRQRVWMARRRGERIDWPWKPGETDFEHVVTPRHLLEAYVAAVEGRPHVVHGDPQSALERAYAGDAAAFDLAHDPTLYRALAWLVITGRRWARRNGRKWHDLFARGGPGSYPARHQFCFALWQLAESMPEKTAAADLARSGATDERFQTLIDRLVENGDTLGDAAAEAVVAAAAATSRQLDADLAKREFFTAAVKAAVAAQRNPVEAPAAADSAPVAS